MYFNDDGTFHKEVDLKNTKPADKVASGMIILGRPWTYRFCVTDGIGHYYGNTGTMTSNCTWAMDKQNNDCKIVTATEEGAFATFTFNVNYSDMTKPVVTVVYPEKHQTSGKVIYFDNTPVSWTKIHYRVGDNSWTIKEKMTIVPGTANLYKCTTPDRNNIAAWHITNNSGWSDGNTIFRTKTGDGYAITHSIEFEGAATQDAITIIPESSGSKGSGELLDNCYFHP